MTYEEARALIQEHLDYGGSLDSHGLAVAMSSPQSIADTAGAALYHPSLGGVANSVNAANVAAGIADTAGAKPDYINDPPTPDKLVCGDLNTPDAERDLAEICKRFGWNRNKHALVDQDGVFRMRTADALRIYALHFPPVPSVADAAGASKLDQFDYARSLLPRDTFWGEHLTPAMVLHIAREAIAKGVR